jgi:hypothetical protein
MLCQLLGFFMPVFLLQFQYHFVGATPIEIHRENLLEGKNIRVAILEVIETFFNCQK